VNPAGKKLLPRGAKPAASPGGGSWQKKRRRCVGFTRGGTLGM